MTDELDREMVSRVSYNPKLRITNSHDTVPGSPRCLTRAAKPKLPILVMTIPYGRALVVAIKLHPILGLVSLHLSHTDVEGA